MSKVARAAKGHAPPDATNAPIALLAVDHLAPNAYNPNEMTEAEFAELVAEVRHLGRLPKPVIVRPNGSGYVIVDGEHGWRAAREVGLAEVPCEVVAVDDFEAMRQTYKRNQHGTHNPVRLGQMFQQMMADRELSQRALAAAIEISEGTVRNAISYAEAASLRNSYAFEKLSVRQVRAYLGLPLPIADAWLDSGADLETLREATLVPIESVGVDGAVTTETRDFAEDHDGWAELVTADLVRAIRASDFLTSARRAFQIWDWRRHVIDALPDIDLYIRPVADLALGTETLNQLPCELEDARFTILTAADAWGELLRDCTARSPDNAETRAQMISASLRRLARKDGREVDGTNPIIGEFLDMLASAPVEVRDASISLWDKINLLRAVSDLPAAAQPPVLLDALSIIKARDGWLTGCIDDHTELDAATRKDWRRVQARARKKPMTVASAVAQAMHDYARAERATRRSRLQDDPRARRDTIRTVLHRHFYINRRVIDGKPA